MGSVDGVDTVRPGKNKHVPIKIGLGLLSLISVAVAFTLENIVKQAVMFKDIACKEQFPRIKEEKNIPPNARLTPNKDLLTECTVAWTNAKGVKETYSWNPVENVVTFPAAAVKTPAAMVPAQ